MKMPNKNIFFILIIIISLNFVSSSLGYDNPNLPRLEGEEEVTAGNTTNNYYGNTTNIYNNYTFNATQFDETGGNVNLLESWVIALGNGLWCSIGACGNTSWNQTTAELLFTNKSYVDETNASLATYINSILNETIINVGNTLWCSLSGCNFTGSIIVDGNVTADYFIGDGSYLTGIQAEESDFETYINGSIFNDIHYNLTAGDVDDVERTIEPGKQFIFGGEFT